MTETCAEKAQQLVDSGKAYIVLNTPTLIMGKVKHNQILYGVALYPNGEYYCDCPWGRYSSHPDEFCPHTLAVKLAVERM